MRMQNSSTFSITLPQVQPRETSISASACHSLRGSGSRAIEAIKPSNINLG